MAPEQKKGEISIDGKSDIWSLGVTLYELCYGRELMRKFVKQFVDSID